MADNDKYPKRYPASSRDPVKQETGVEDLARMNVNKRVLDSPKNGPNINPDDQGRYERKDYRTPERKRESSRFHDKA
jgi:hypothetical protein